MQNTAQKQQNTDFLCERRLYELDRNLHTCYRNSVFAIDRLLTNYKMVFPFFTNHTFEHSTQVINYCNAIAGEENVNKLNEDELYVLLMGAALHDIGMGISHKDLDEMKGQVPGVEEYIETHPNAVAGDITRAFHQEFSATFIRKYAQLFEIPSEEYVYCICQVARGHRKMNLLDPAEYPKEFRMPSGNTVCLPYLAALVKLADELDLTADRNLMLDYSKVFDRLETSEQYMCYKCHEAIKHLYLTDHAIVLTYQTNEPRIEDEIKGLEGKANETFRQYEEVVKDNPRFTLRQTKLEFLKDESV